MSAVFSRTPLDPKREQRENKERTAIVNWILRRNAKREQRENKERTPYYSLAPRLTLKERTKREQRENKERTAIVNWILGRNAKREQRENKERTKREQREKAILFSICSLTPRLTFYNVTIHKGGGPRGLMCCNIVWAHRVHVGQHLAHAN